MFYDASNYCGVHAVESHCSRKRLPLQPRENLPGAVTELLYLKVRATMCGVRRALRTLIWKVCRKFQQLQAASPELFYRCHDTKFQKHRYP